MSIKNTFFLPGTITQIGLSLYLDILFTARCYMSICQVNIKVIYYVDFSSICHPLIKIFACWSWIIMTHIILSENQHEKIRPIAIRYDRPEHCYIYKHNHVCRYTYVIHNWLINWAHVQSLLCLELKAALVIASLDRNSSVLSSRSNRTLVIPSTSRPTLLTMNAFIANVIHRQNIWNL